MKTVVQNADRLLEKVAGFGRKAGTAAGVAGTAGGASLYGVGHALEGIAGDVASRNQALGGPVAKMLGMEKALGSTDDVMALRAAGKLSKGVGAGMGVGALALLVALMASKKKPSLRDRIGM